MIRLALLIVAIIHLLPLVGVLGAGRLESLYGIAFADPNLLILMRHRAVMFGLLGGLMLAAVFVPRLQPWALALALLSAGSFLVFVYGGDGGHNPLLARVALVDVVAVIAALVGLAAWAFTRKASDPQRPS